MPLKTQIAWLSLAVACFGPPAAAQSPSVQSLVDQAVYWQARGRSDLAADTWQKVLRMKPDHPEALSGLGLTEIEAARWDSAKRYLSRLNQLHPDHPATRRLEQAIASGKNYKERLVDARRLAQEGQAGAAVERYRSLFDGARLSGDLAMEYYQTLGGTNEGWSEAKKGLETLVKENRSNPRYTLALAQIYTYREATRRTGIRILTELVGKPEVGKEAAESWRQALIWLDARPKDAGLYQAYLRQYPQDTAMRERVTSQPRRAGLSPRSDVPEFDFRDLARAEAGFQQRVKARPRDADALGGLGIVRLRQERFSESRELLQRAMAVSPESRPKWGRALQTATYWELVKQAEAARKARKSEEAERLLHEAIRVDAKEPMAHIALGDVLVERGDLIAAEAKYREVLGRSPQHPEGLRALINLLVLERRDEEALALARTLTDKQMAAIGDRRRLRANVLRAEARVAESKGEQAAAKRSLEEALLADPDNAWARLDLARLYRRQGAGAQAQGIADSLSSSPPEKPEALYAGAIYSSEQQQWREGLLTLERIPSAARSSEMARLQRRLWTRAQIDRAIAYARRGQQARGQEILSQAESAAGTDADSLAALSGAYLNSGDSTRSMASIRKAMTHTEKPSAGLRLQYAAVLLRTDQLTELEPLLRQLDQEQLEGRERADLAALKAGLALQQADRAREEGRLKDAYDYLAPALAEQPENSGLVLALGQLYSAAGEPEQALERFESVRKREPSNLDARLLAIGAAIELKDYPRADALMSETTAQFPEDPRVEALAGRLARIQGKDAKAMKHFQRALTLERETAAQRAPQLRMVGTESSPSAAERAGGRAGDAARHSEATGPRLPRSSTLTPGAAGVAVPAQAGAGGAGFSNAPAKTFPRRTQTSVEDEIAGLRSQYSSYVAGAGVFRGRRGEAGLDRLTDIELPLEGSIAPGYGGRLTARVIPVYLNAGTLNLGDSARARRFGANSLIVPGVGGGLDQRESGVALGVGYDSGVFGVDVGTNPIGFPVRYLVGGVRLTPHVGNTYMSFELSQRAVTESLLSYSGTRDNVTGRTWGGVRATGGRFDITWDQGGYGVYGNLGYRSLTGREVESNSVMQAGAGAYRHFLRTEDERVTGGVDLTSLRYDKNLGFFTLGHGGYFSPQNYIHLSFPVEWTGRSGRLAYQLKGAVGVQHFRQDRTAYFPRDPDLQAALEQRAASNPALGLETFHSGTSTTGIGLNLYGALEYKVSPHLFLGGTLGFDNTRDYTQGVGSVFVRYWFEPQSGPIHFPPRPVKPFFSERAP